MYAIGVYSDNSVALGGPTATIQLALATLARDPSLRFFKCGQIVSGVVILIYTSASRAQTASRRLGTNPTRKP